MPKVTVYITNYNYESYIKQAIDSVLNQTFSNLELLVIDDGSVDNSKEIINSYESNPKVKAIFQNRKGLNASNNVALKNSSGEFIVRLDADDFLDEHAIEKMFDLLKKNQKAAIVFPDYFNVNINGEIINRVFRHDFNKEVSLLDQPAHGACTMIRKSVLEEVGGYDEDFDRQDGYDIWLKVIFNYQVMNLNEPLFYYRQHGKNLTKNDLELFKTRASIKRKHVNLYKKESINCLAVVPFRGKMLDESSKPLKKLDNKELLFWTIDQALLSENIDKIVISSPDLESLNKAKESYGGKIETHKRAEDLAKLNSSLKETILEIIKREEDKGNHFDIVTVLYIDYPFKSFWQIDESIDTLRLFDVDSVDGVLLDNRFYYKHLGKGMEPIVEGGGLKLERDQLYRRVGGIHSIFTQSIRETPNLLGDVIGHINFDPISGFQIRSDLDWEVAKIICKKFLKQ